MNPLTYRAFTEELIKISAPEKKPFWSQVKKLESGCWEWTGGKSKLGYGVHRDGDKIELASRTAWKLSHGDEPAGDKVIAHSCDNRDCVNPKHLKLTDQKHNLQDMHDKGRHPHN